MRASSGLSGVSTVPDTTTHHAHPAPTPNCQPISADERADVRKKSLLTHRLEIKTDYNSLIPPRPA